MLYCKYYLEKIQYFHHGMINTQILTNNVTELLLNNNLISKDAICLYINCVPRNNKFQ